MKKTTSEYILKYDVLFEEQPEGGFTVTVPTLSGCVSEGDTFEKAKENITDAIKLYLDDLTSDLKQAGIDKKELFK